MKSTNSAVICFILALCGLLLATTASAGTETVDGDAVPQVRQTCPVDACPAIPPTLITGTIGSCDDWPACTTGIQNARLNRNAVPSDCATPKVCDIFASGNFPYDAYVIPNATGATACVTAELTVITQTGCNLQIDGYLNTFDPASICEPNSDYLADAGVSSGVPPVVTSWCENVPDGDDLILVFHSTSTDLGVGCDYEIRLYGACIPVELQQFSAE